ncbi:hypothetical protein DPMN_129500 [Dreissena polymorpha]|uniref:Uncharacterized protein n=1 Tax=Dreissena polymorpha TaxID=45954 RepID=A0A9D4H511_DREPO|nr:hypothetical protein DPMN_129500 [Dreissena polymorpha]
MALRQEDVRSSDDDSQTGRGLVESLWPSGRTGLGPVIITVRQDGARSSQNDSQAGRGLVQSL